MSTLTLSSMFNQIHVILYIHCLGSLGSTDGMVDPQP